MDIKNTKFAPICIWCSAPWSDKNVNVFQSKAGRECSSGWLSFPEASIQITCHKCEKLMYKKDGFEIY